ncbi:MAG: P-loop NTPase [Candidatus Asgardarchaeia archaeon]
MNVKEIVIISAKGGVGKTTLSSSLAVELSKKIPIVAADTDVDAPNLGIILGCNSERQIPIHASEKAFVDFDTCINCGLCAQKCPEGALQMIDGQLHFTYHLCEGCGVCSLVCPVNAIEIKRVESGVIKIGKSRYGFPCITGELHIGESASGQIVTSAKRFAQMEAWKYKANVVIIDGPPGSSCPTISSVTGAHYVILTTEPTPAALSDLDRAVGIAEHFNVPHGIVINKADLVPDFREKVHEYAKRKNIEILGEIPYDREVPVAIANLIPVVEYSSNSPAAIAMKRISEKVLEIIKSLS